MEVSLFLALAGFILDNAPRVADMIDQHKNGTAQLTQEQVDEMLKLAEADSAGLNDAWKDA